MIMGILRTTENLGLSKALSKEETNSQPVFMMSQLEFTLATSHLGTLAHCRQMVPKDLPE